MGCSVRAVARILLLQELSCKLDKRGLRKVEVGGCFSGFGHKTRGDRWPLVWAVPKLFDTPISHFD